MRASASSRSRARSVSTAMRLVSMGSTRKVHSATTPVSPMPPAVAQNRAPSRSGVTTFVAPSASTMVNEVTWLAKEPST